jgi:hypothetical protein
VSPTNGGSSWETARPIFARAQNDQTNGNQIVALGNGDLANVMMVFTNGIGHQVAIVPAVPVAAVWCCNFGAPCTEACQPGAPS